MFSLMWSEHCAYKHSRKLLRRFPTEGPRVVMGPGENAGAVDVGGGRVGRVQGRVAQPSQRRGAVPGRRDRGRRDPARRVRARRTTDRSARLSALRRARLGALAIPVRSRRRGDRPLRELDRRADRGRRGVLRAPLRAQLPRQRDVRRARGRRPHGSLRRCGARERRRDPRRFDGPRRDRGCVGPRVGRARGGGREAPVGPDRGPVRGEEADGVLPGAARPRAAGRASGPGRRRADLLFGGDGGEGRSRDRDRRRAGAAARGRPRAVRGDDLRVPGADARRGRSRSPGRGAGGVRAVADGRRRDRNGHRHVAYHGPAGRGGRRRRPGRCPGGRMPPLRPRARRARGLDVRQRGNARGRRTGAGPAVAAGVAEHRVASGGRSSSTTRSCSRERCAGPSPRTRRC